MSSKYLIGKLAVIEGLVTQEQVDECLAVQALLPGQSLGQLLVERGYVTEDQLEHLVGRQKVAFNRHDTMTGRPKAEVLFGQVALRLDLVREQDLNAALRLQGTQTGRGRIFLGEILVRQGAMTSQQRDQVLSAQNKLKVACTSCGMKFNFPEVKLHRVGDIACLRCGGELARLEPEPEPEPDPEGDDELEVFDFGSAFGDGGQTMIREEEKKKGWGDVVDLEELLQSKTESLVTKELGDYLILEKLGEGGMGTVYKAQHRTIKREVALKVVPNSRVSSEDRMARFFLEAESMGQLTHPNIVQIYNVGEVDDYYFIEMELVKGGSLEDIIEKQDLFSIEEALPYFKQICKGLEQAHRNEVVHRDIKPANILATEDGTLKLADFGLAKNLTAKSDLTTEGSLMGTPDYMSPEQCRGQTVSLASDVYSLGALFYFMVTGRKPFVADDPMVIVFQHIERELEPPILHAPDLPLSYSNIIERMMAKEPSERYQDVSEVLDVLHMAEQGDKIAYTARRVRRRRFRRMLAAILFLALSGAGVFGVWFFTQAKNGGTIVLGESKVDTLLNDGKARFSSMEFKAAVQDFKGVLAREKAHPEAEKLLSRAERLQTAKALMALGKGSEAQADLKVYRENYPDCSPGKSLHEQLGRILAFEALLDSGEYAEADGAAQALAKFQPVPGYIQPYARALPMLTNALSLHGRGESVPALEKAQQAFVTSGEDQRLQAPVQETAAAILAAAEKALGKGEFDRASFLTAAILRVLASHSEADALSAKVAREKKAYLDLVAAGTEHGAAGRFSQALDAFQRAAKVKTDPDLVKKMNGARYGLHLVQAGEAVENNRFDDALTAFAKAEKFAPKENPIAEQRRACLEKKYRIHLDEAQKSLHAGNLDRAKREVAEAIEVGENPREAHDLAVTIRQVEATPEGMVYVPDGRYSVGREGERQNPLRSVELTPFYLGKTEVSNAEFKAFVDAKGYQKKELWDPKAWQSILQFRCRRGTKRGPGHWVDGTFREGTADQPVTHVSWYEAQAYARWKGSRLPTEEEWEVGAGFDLQAGGLRVFPWGNEWLDRTGRFYLEIVAPALADTKDALGDVSPFGCFHMAGNTAEWTSSWWNPDEKKSRVVKGTSVFLESPQTHGKVAHRFRCPPLITRVRIVGFRLARSAR